MAELLWELKKAQKVATYTTLAKQAGFSAGMNGRTMATTIRTIRRDWPHLEWWRAVSDDGLLQKESEHEEKLRQSGYELEEAKGKRGSGHQVIKALDDLAALPSCAARSPRIGHAGSCYDSAPGLPAA